MPLILALIVLLGGGTTSALAQNSLPGDILYPVKIHLNENVESMLALTTQGDAEVDAKQASRRLKEAEKLASEGKLNENLNKEIENSFLGEVNSLDKHLSELDKKGASTTALKIRNEFENEVENHYKYILVLSGTNISTSTASSTASIEGLLSIIKKQKELNKEEKEQEKELEKERTEFRKETDKSVRESDEGDDEGDNEDEGDDDHGSGATSTIQTAQNTTQQQTQTQTTKSYTLAEVASHNTAQSCYTAVNSSVYDVTSWIKQHPGGEQAIIGMCGKDASSAFDAQHGGQSRPESELASFKIGVLVK